MTSEKVKPARRWYDGGLRNSDQLGGSIGSDCTPSLRTHQAEARVAIVDARLNVLTFANAAALRAHLREAL